MSAIFPMCLYSFLSCCFLPMCYLEGQVLRSTCENFFQTFMFGFGFKQFRLLQQRIMIPAAQILITVKRLNAILHKFIS